MAGAYSTFLFDLDGTLLDSIELIRSSYRHTLRQHLGAEIDEAEWLEGLGRPLLWQFARHVRDAAEIEAMVRTYRAHNFEHHDRMVRPYAGAQAALQALKQRGARVAVVTSKTRDGAWRGLRHGALDAYVDAVVGCDEVQAPKPAPQPAQLALERLGAGTLGAVMIGDSPHDIACGRDAGIKTAVASWGPFPRARLERERPDHYLDTPEHIARL